MGREAERAGEESLHPRQGDNFLAGAGFGQRSRSAAGGIICQVPAGSIGCAEEGLLLQ